jgi:hypothetical protein
MVSDKVRDEVKKQADGQIFFKIIVQARSQLMDHVWNITSTGVWFHVWRQTWVPSTAPGQVHDY